MFLKHFRRETRSFAFSAPEDEKSRTLQSHREDADINVIVRRFGVTGQLPNQIKPPMTGDFSEVFDFQTAMDAVVAARESFMELSAAVRKRFHNDPQEFVEFCSAANEDGKLKNLKEMRDMGLAIPEVVPEPEPKPMRVEVVNPASDPK